MNINSSKLFQGFKYTIYALLAINVYLFFAAESLAATLQYSGGIRLADLIGAYAATIDTAAWVILLLMFELETCLLDDRHYNAVVTWSLHVVRFFCYAFIVYAFYGYVINLMFVNLATAYPDMSDVCALVSDGWSYAVNLDEYVQLSTANCGTLSSATEFFRFQDMRAVVDANGLADIRKLAWVDVINSAVWLLVVLVLEIDVWLQEKNRLEGFALRASNAAKFILYFALLLAAIYWGVKGDFVDFWDAFLWLVAFVFIELNVLEWRHEVRKTSARAQVSSATLKEY